MKIQLSIILCSLCVASFSCTDSALVEELKVVSTPVSAAAQPITQKLIVVKKGEVTEVLVEQVFELRSSERALLIDTRPPIFFALGHIEGAINVPLKHFEKSYPANQAQIAQAVAEGKILVVYCANQVCVDSHRMAGKLAERGYNASVFKGGWELWRETGLE